MQQSGKVTWDANQPNNHTFNIDLTQHFKNKPVVITMFSGYGLGPGLNSGFSEYHSLTCSGEAVNNPAKGTGYNQINISVSFGNQIGPDGLGNWDNFGVGEITWLAYDEVTIGG